MKPIACRVVVSADEPEPNSDIFAVELHPIGYTFPEGFFIMRQLNNVADLEEYLQEGTDEYSWEQNYHGDPEEDELIQQMQAPFNDVEALISLSFSMQNVAFEPAAFVLLKIYHHYMPIEELQEKNIEQLRIIACLKEAHLASKKPQLIQNILEKQSDGSWSVYGIKTSSTEENRENEEISNK